MYQKRILAAFTAAAVIMSLSACGKRENAQA